MKIIDVTCAIILNKKKVLVAQRSQQMTLPLKWEFPGGKIDANESEEECIIRELREELNINVNIKRRLSNCLYNYDSVKILLIPFVVEYINGEVQVAEHKAIKWCTKKSLLKLDWAPADIPVLQEFLELQII